MRYIFPFNSAATNVYFLLIITLSYLCFPIFAFILTHLICGWFPAISEYWQQFSASTAFLVVGIYSIVAIVTMYISYFRRKASRMK